jgi:hypothetical protein
MKLSTGIVIQVCGIVAQIGNALLLQTQLIKGTSALVIGALIAVAQAVSGYISHISNMDGSAATK